MTLTLVFDGDQVGFEYLFHELRETGSTLRLIFVIEVASFVHIILFPIVRRLTDYV